MGETQIAITLDDDTLALLEASAKFRSLSREEMLKEAIKDAAAYDRYYRESVEAVLKDAAKGKLIPNEAMKHEVAALIQSFESGQTIVSCDR